MKFIDIWTVMHLTVCWESLSSAFYWKSAKFYKNFLTPYGLEQYNGSFYFGKIFVLEQVLSIWEIKKSGVNST